MSLVTYSPLIQGIKLCLCMIVKNESKIIERLLNSIYPLLKDGKGIVCITDTGSTDNTVELMNNYIQSHGLYGQIFTSTFVNFAKNRTESFTNARDYIISQGWNPLEFYALLMDADMLLIESQFNPQELEFEGYMVDQRNPLMIYANTRLINLGKKWQCLGVTHEYWDCQEPNHKIGKVHTLLINDINDGGCKADKYERDIRLLTQGIIDEPTNSRYLFYLAQSYKDSGKFDEGIEWYRKRVNVDNMNNWNEERWYAQYAIGLCFEFKGDWANAEVEYLKAYEMRPTRAEPLYQISHHYRLIPNSNNRCLLFARIAKEIPFPQNDLLFISHPVYEFLLDEDIAIAAYYTNHRNIGLPHCEHIILNRSVPHNIKSGIIQNEQFYMKGLCIPDNKYDIVDHDIKNIITQEIRSNKSRHIDNQKLVYERYRLTNPSIVKTKKGFTGIVRSVNYNQVGAKYYDILDDDEHVRTINYFVDFDKNMNIQNTYQVLDTVNRTRYPTRIHGIEDMRLFKFKDEWWFTCTQLDVVPSGVPRVCLGKLGQRNNEHKTINVELFTGLQGPYDQADKQLRCEKNWMPFVYKNQILIIYSIDPYIILKPDIEKMDGTCEIFKKCNYKQDVSRLRGGGAPVPYNGGWLMCVHEKFYVKGQINGQDSEKGIYTHRFLLTDENLTVNKISIPFYFRELGVEFCASLTHNIKGDGLVLGVGYEDREAHAVEMKYTDVEKLLNSLQ